VRQRQLVSGAPPKKKQLTAAQIKAAYKKTILSLAQALSDLEERGYSAADAATYLAS